MHSSYNQSKEYLAQYKDKVIGELPEDMPKKVHCFLDYVLGHLFDDSLSVTRALRECKIKSKNFSSQFSLFTGTTPKRFITEHRITAGKYLLVATDRSITQISILTGFSSHSAFSKAFKNRLGGGKSF